MSRLGDIFKEFDSGTTQAVVEPVQQPVQQESKLGSLFASFDTSQPEPPQVDISNLTFFNEAPPQTVDFGDELIEPSGTEKEETRKPVDIFDKRDLTVSRKSRKGTEIQSTPVDPAILQLEEFGLKEFGKPLKKIAKPATKEKPIEAQKYKGFFNEFGRSFKRGALGVGAGIAGTAQSAQDFLDQGKFGGTFEDIAEALREKQKGIKPSKGGPKVRKFIANAVGETLPFMAGTLGATLVGGPLAAASVSFSVEGDNAYRDALESGASEEDAQVDRLIVGSINAALEKLQIDKLLGSSTSSGKIIKGIIKAAREKAWKQVAKKGAKLGVETLKTSVTEGIQEALQETTSAVAPGARKAVKGEEFDKPFKKPEGFLDAIKGGFLTEEGKQVGKRIGSAALGGAVAGGILGGGGGLIQSLSEQETDSEGFLTVELESTQDALDAAKSLAEEAEKKDLNVEIKTDGNKLSVKELEPAEVVEKEPQPATAKETQAEPTIERLEAKTAQTEAEGVVSEGIPAKPVVGTEAVVDGTQKVSKPAKKATPSQKMIIRRGAHDPVHITFTDENSKQVFSALAKVRGKGALREGGFKTPGLLKDMTDRLGVTAGELIDWRDSVKAQAKSLSPQIEEGRHDIEIQGIDEFLAEKAKETATTREKETRKAPQPISTEKSEGLILTPEQQKIQNSIEGSKKILASDISKKQRLASKRQLRNLESKLENSFTEEQRGVIEAEKVKPLAEVKQLVIEKPKKKRAKKKTAKKKFLHTKPKHKKFAEKAKRKAEAKKKLPKKTTKPATKKVTKPVAAVPVSPTGKPTSKSREKALDKFQKSDVPKPRGLSKSIEKAAVEKGLTNFFENIPEFQSVDLKDQADQATSIVNTNPDQAKRIAMGQEVAPKGVVPEMVLVAVSNKALKEGDVDTLRDIATASSLTTEATKMGQRIRALGELDRGSPIKAMAKVAKVREEAYAKKHKKKNLSAEKKIEVKEIKDSIKRAKAKNGAKALSDFITALEC